MRTWITLSGSVAAALLFASASAWGHAVLSTPPPRDPTCDDATCKTGPCGGQTPGAPKLKFEKDAEVKVEWEETIDHQGCYVLELSTNGTDNNWQVLETRADEQDVVPKKFTSTLNLADAGDGGSIECERCVLRLRQIMSGTSVGCTAETDASTYFSCADIIIGTNAQIPPPDPGPGGDDAGTQTGNDAGAPPPGGGNQGPYEVDPITPASGKGCTAAPVGLSYGGLIGLSMVFGFSALQRWRRRRGRSGS